MRILTVLALLVCATPLASVVADMIGGTIVSHEMEPALGCDESCGSCETEEMVVVSAAMDVSVQHDDLLSLYATTPHASPDQAGRLRPPNR